MGRAVVPFLAAILLVSLLPGSAVAFKREHHADPKKAFKKHRWPRKARAAALDPAAFASTWECTTEPTTDLGRVPVSNAPQVKVIYAYASDGTDNFATFADVAQADAKAIRDRLATDSGNTKSVRFDTGGAGGPCDGTPAPYLDIQKVQLQEDKAHYNTAGQTFNRVTAELKSVLAQPSSGARVNYVVYLDDIAVAGASGEADISLDDSHGVLNASNQGQTGSGRLFALIYDTNPAQSQGSRRATFLHELSHNLGAVQDSAPNSTLAAHCFDEWDVMCYADGGSGGPLDFTACPAGIEFDFSEAFDCNGDDYFDPSPAAGSYLAQRWNAYDSVFLCPIDSCDAALTQPSASLATAHPGGVLSLSASSDSAIAHYEWDVDGDGIFDHDTGSTPALTPVWDTPGTRDVRVRASKVDGAFGIDTLAVTPTTPTPGFSVQGTLAVGQPLLLDGSQTDDPDGLITKFLWDLDGDGSYETDTGLGRTTTTTFAAPGEYSLGLEIDYPFGMSWSRTSPFTVAPAAATPGAAVPGATPTPPPAAIASPTLSAVRVKLAKLLKSGLPLTVKCAAPCSVSFTLSVDARTAKKLKLKGRRGKPVVIGRVKATFRAGTARTALKLGAAAKRALKRSKRLSATLRGSVTQPPELPLRVSKKLAFRR